MSLTIQQLPYRILHDSRSALRPLHTRIWMHRQYNRTGIRQHQSSTVTRIETASPEVVAPASSAPDDVAAKAQAQTEPAISTSTNASHTSSSTSQVELPPSTSLPKIRKDETPVERAVRVAKDGDLAAMENAWQEAELEDTSPKEKKSITQRVKDELVHYWHGTKLLGAEIAISSRIMWQLLHGHKLTRREQRQLRRTTGDMLRLVPFLIFVIVPFLEFALPIVLRFFPNMLPSTFESKFDEQAKKKRLLKVRLEMAKFLQDTIEDMSVAGTSRAEAAKEFSDFFMKYRSSGEQPAIEEIIKIARKCKDNPTLNNLSRPQLISICKYMNINAFGTDNFLRHQIDRKMRALRADDKVIAEEGIESLNVKELQQACASRGIRTVGVSIARLRSELAQWLELHLNNQIPSTLLIISLMASYARLKQLPMIKSVDSPIILDEIMVLAEQADSEGVGVVVKDEQDERKDGRDVEDVSESTSAVSPSSTRTDTKA
ncbi:hypothetical protein SeMB42_g02050 [Synchytrium endobioticum]|uniref:Letm1 RBD domain-containing protein n=1 Tax=Synchytrium endobioticum TaxID=286115 RepID=A0A507DIF9_9FUNG|nr:hypothetical protein SeMB42_g02050 [Synchytrium endobioticum]